MLTALFAFLAVGFLAAASPAQALFTVQAGSNTTGAGTDFLHRHFLIVPGSATQPGTATPAASGAGGTISVDLGRVPDSRTIADVLRVTNTTTASRPLDLALVGSLAGVAGFEYSDGTTVKSLAPGVTWQLRLRTDATAAGHFYGALRFQQGSDVFLRLDRPFSSSQAPLPVPALAIAPPNGVAQAQLTWTASPSTGVAGYNVYRATAAGPFVKVNSTPVAGTSFADATVALGGSYWYLIRAVTTGVSPELESPDSPAAQTAVLPAPAIVQIPAGAANNLNWVTLATRANVTFQVAVPAGTMPGDTVSLTATSGSSSLTRTAVATGGAQTISFTGNNLTSWPNGALGSISIGARIVRGAFSGPALVAGAGKDVTAPTAPTAAQVIAGAQNPANFVNSLTASAATISITSPATATDSVQARLAVGAASGTGAVAGPAAANVPVNVTVNAAALPDTGVGGLAVAARVVDQAGNPSAWFSGTPATKDTVAPASPNVTRIVFTDRRRAADRVRGNSGSLAANAQVRAIDYANNGWFPTGGRGWQNGSAAGAFNAFNLASGGRPRTIGFESRDAAWNTTPRVCGRWTVSNSAGSTVACP